VTIGDISVTTSGDVLAKVAEWIVDLFKKSLKDSIAK
jgi:hypothetical protein